MQANRPKQYLELAGKTLLEHTVENLLSHPRIRRVILALHPDDPYFSQLTLAQHKRVVRVDGGKERADSVLAGLNADNLSDWVLVHDAARPCLSHEDLDRLLSLADTGTHGGLLASPVRDTMKRENPDKPGVVSHTEDREGMWHALTPQFFPTVSLRTALQIGLATQHAITDEASAMELAGQTVQLVEGCSSNIKVTRPEDLALAEFYLSRRSLTCA